MTAFELWHKLVKIQSAMFPILRKIYNITIKSDKAKTKIFGIYF